MAKELPYFRFTAAEWLNGDISLESTYIKGIFIDICSYYWFKDCSVTKAILKKKYSNDVDGINDLIELGILKHDKETDYLCINFLNEQYDLLSEMRKRRQNAGSKGGKQKSSNAKAELKQGSSYKDKDKDNNKDKYKTSLLSELKNSDVDNEKYLEITLAFYELFKKNLTDVGASLTIINKAKGTWIDSIRLLIETDKQTIENLTLVYKFLQVDEFWKKNILSTSKLREKFNKLLMNAKSDGINKGHNKKEGTTYSELSEILSRHFD